MWVNIMKKIILIGGTMGVGKTVTSQILKKKLNHSVFLDGDWCWDMNPFIVNEQTKEMVMDNIVYMLNNFIHCHDIENIIFCWVMHQQDIIDEIVSRLDKKECKIYPISLICSKEALTKHIQEDIEKGIRQQDVLKRSLERLDMYQLLRTKHIDITYLSIEDTAQVIYDYVNSQ